MLYVTGDTHGELSRFQTKAFRRLKKRDTLIVLGDFGFIWDGSKREKKALKWLSKRRYRLLFLDGSHENYDLLEAYPTTAFSGGTARKIAENIFWLQRGEIYELEGKTLFVFGGAESLDKETRAEGKTWFRQEVPSPEQFEKARQNLTARRNRVDYILTHDAPARLADFLHLSKDSVLYEATQLELFFNDLYQHVQYDKWLFGRYHKDQKLGAKSAAVFKALLPLNG